MAATTDPEERQAVQDRRRGGAHAVLEIEDDHHVEAAARQGAGKERIPAGSVGNPAGLHFQNPIRHAVGDHLPDVLLTGLARPLSDRMRVVGGAKRLGPQAANHLSGIIDHGAEHDGVVAVAQCVDVESAFHATLAVTPNGARRILGPQFGVGGRLGNNERALDVGVGPAKALAKREASDRGAQRCGLSSVSSRLAPDCCCVNRSCFIRLVSFLLIEIPDDIRQHNRQSF